MYRVIYEETDFIVLSKYAGFLSIKARGSLSNEISVFDDLKKRYNKIYIVHRLDKDTSGIMLFAKNKSSHKILCGLFESKSIDKRYLALVFGDIKSDSFKVEKSIKEFGSGRMGVSSDGKNAVTEFSVVKRFDKYTLIEAKPITGKRHQIRVHLYWYGNPIVGDKLYGDISKQKEYKRMMLHSSYLSFSYGGNTYKFRDEDEFLKEIYKTINL